ncbi:Alpha/Beta hydrolase protein [Penicillium maclennaniae]|uniref:Alpha/Beta hydrolase protein n=1 Tax=Penicillium maclennaniae TaxID=1343394 RepID=UPI00253FA927|nr:Alpha/Beta hydrolase protein [Penicillium maclennaniae]KAJ5662642.1 Alpha/Beta hydrolase protein [Penicillium maclennaniae]
MARVFAEEYATPSGWRTREPGFIIWAFISLLSVLLHIFFYSIYFLPGYLRPSGQWSYRQALTSQLMRVVLSVLADLGFKRPLSLEAHNQEEQWVVMEYGPAEAYQGPISSSFLRLERIGATWYPSTPPKAPSGAAACIDDNGLIILCFHSGLGDDTRALWVQYRLAGDPKKPTPYPGPIQDALTAYLFLADEFGIPPHRIVLAGDCSGATLAVALLRYISSDAEKNGGLRGQNLPAPPKACLIFSPPVDYSAEGDSQGIDMHRNHKIDYVEGRTAAWGARSFAPPPFRLDNPYLSSLASVRNAGTHLRAGAEVLYETIRAFTEAMQTIPGNRVKYLEVSDAPHDIFMVGNILGWLKEAEGSVDAAAAFLSRM